MPQSNMRKIAALWQKKSQKGTTFYSGKFDVEKLKDALNQGETSILLFKVKDKRNPKAPDLELFAVPPYTGQRQTQDAAPMREPGDEFGDLP